jgi:hypothetical protein
MCVLLVRPVDLTASAGYGGLLERIGGGERRLVVLSWPIFFQDWEATWRGEDDIWKAAQRIGPEPRKVERVIAPRSLPRPISESVTVT